MLYKQVMDEAFNFIVLGANQTGKTSLIYQFTENNFPTRTIDDEVLEIYPKKAKITILEQTVKLNIFECKHELRTDEKFLIDGFIILFSCNDNDKLSLEFAKNKIETLKKNQQKKDHHNILLVANKIDLLSANDTAKIKKEIASLMDARNLNIYYMEVSARNNLRVTECFERLTKIRLLQKYPNLERTVCANKQKKAEKKLLPGDCILKTKKLMNSLLDNYFDNNVYYVLPEVHDLKQNFSVAIEKYFSSNDSAYIINRYEKTVSNIYEKWFQQKKQDNELKFLIKLTNLFDVEKTLFNKVIKLNNLITIDKCLNNAIADVNSKFHEEMLFYNKNIKEIQNLSILNNGFIQKHNFAKTLIENLSVNFPMQKLNLKILSDNLVTLRLNLSNENHETKKLKKLQSKMISSLLEAYIDLMNLKDYLIHYQPRVHKTSTRLFKNSDKINILLYYQQANKNLKNPEMVEEGEKMLQAILTIKSGSTSSRVDLPQEEKNNKQTKPVY